MTVTTETASPGLAIAATPAVPSPPSNLSVPGLDVGRIAQDLQIRKAQVESVVQLLDEGNTVPFITRYRKERTGGLNHETIRLIQKRVHAQRQFAERKLTVLKSVRSAGKLTDELEKAILAAETMRRLEDLYLPFKPRRKTVAGVAREQGLEPLAISIWNREPVAAELGPLWPTFVNPEKGVATPEEVQQGVGHILAEMIADTAEIREAARHVLWTTGKLTAAKNEMAAAARSESDSGPTAPTSLLPHSPPEKGDQTNPLSHPDQGAQTSTPSPSESASPSPPASADRRPGSTGQETASRGAAGKGRSGGGTEYKDYFAFSEPLRQIPPHRVLAINRGEKENVLKVNLDWNKDALEQAVLGALSDTLRATECASLSRYESPTATEGAASPAPTKESDPLADHPHFGLLRASAISAVERLLVPSLEREIRRDLTDRAEEHAIQVFSRNLRRLLLQPPVAGQRVLAIDPAFRGGCRLAALDEAGNLLEDGQFHLPQTGTRKDSRHLDKQSERKIVAAPAEASVPNPAALGGPASAPQPTAGEKLSETPPPEPTPAENPAAAAQDAAAAIPQDPAGQPTAAPSAPPATGASSPGADTVRRGEAKSILHSLIQKHQISLVAIGNGNACRETEELIAELIGERCSHLTYAIINEAGTSHYSGSAVGREEFPHLDATVRATISIGRRLQDPLSELVKIEPQNIGVGLYQHDLSEKRLKESLECVIESCVNHVGVDVNAAGVPLLRLVSGFNQLTARNLVEYRREHGPFKSREQIRQVPTISDAVFTQAAGFLRILCGENPLDATWIHPESYPATQKLLAQMGHDPDSLRDPARIDELREKLSVLPAEDVANLLEIGVPTFRDIAEALSNPGRDPREDLPKPIFRKGLLKIEDLKPGVELKGTVLNVVDFGAFVDVGLKDSGLVHISQLANRFVKSPYDVISVGDVVTVWVLTVDHDRHRVSLTMISPGTERKPAERRAAAPPRRTEGPGQGGTHRPHHGHGRRHRPPPRRQPAVAAQAVTPAVTSTPAAPGGETPAAAASTPPPPRPRLSRFTQQRPADRRPQREKPPPKLSQEQLQGSTELHTFAELKALYEAKKAKE